MPVRAETTATALVLFGAGCWASRRLGFNLTQPMRRAASAATIASCTVLNLAWDGRVGRHEKTLTLLTTALLGGFCVGAAAQPTIGELFKKGFLPSVVGWSTVFYGIKVQMSRTELQKAVNEAIRSALDIGAIFRGTYGMGFESSRERLFNALQREEMVPALPSSVDGLNEQAILELIQETGAHQLPLGLLQTWGEEARRAVETYLYGGNPPERVAAFEERVREQGDAPSGAAQEEAFRRAVEALNVERDRLVASALGAEAPDLGRCDRGRWGLPVPDEEPAEISDDVVRRLQELTAQAAALNAAPELRDLSARVMALEEATEAHSREEKEAFCKTVADLCREYGRLTHVHFNEEGAQVEPVAGDLTADAQKRLRNLLDSSLDLPGFDWDTEYVIEGSRLLPAADKGTWEKELNRIGIDLAELEIRMALSGLCVDDDFAQYRIKEGTLEAQAARLASHVLRERIIEEPSE